MALANTPVKRAARRDIRFLLCAMDSKPAPVLKAADLNIFPCYNDFNALNQNY